MTHVATYAQLLEALKGLTAEQLNSNITVVDSTGEYHGIQFDLKQEEEDDVLDQGHPFLETNRFEINPSVD